MNIKTEPNLPSFPCIHCGRNLLDRDDLEYAIYLYGIFFLEGKDDGFIGTTCPSCVKVTFCRFDKMGFDHIVERCGVLSFQGNPHPDSLRYFSPYAPSPENIPERYKYVSRYGSHVFEGEMNQSLQEMWPGDEHELYHTYIYELGPCIGSYFYNLWMSADQIQELLRIENEQLTSMLPRYVFESELLEKIERFCWIYNYKEDYYKNEINFYNKFDSIKIIENSPYDISPDFHNILTASPNPWLGMSQNNKAIILAWKRSAPFFGAKPSPHQHEKSIEDYKIEALDEGVFKIIKENITKEYAQYFLSENARAYINDYAAVIDNPNWSFVDILELNIKYINKYYKAIKVGISNEHLYAFYENGGTWTIIFDGKKITGLKGSGFMFIHFLLLNENRKITQWDLLNHEANRSYEYEECSENAVKFQENLTVSNNYETSRFIDSNGNVEYLDGSNGNLKDRNGNAIKRAIIQILKRDKSNERTHYTLAAAHFKKSIKGSHSSEIIYVSNNKSIEWYL